MKNTLYIYSLLLAAVMASGGCIRRSMDDSNPTTARIPVRIDWSRSNIPVSTDDPTGGEYIHRVSLRFYPEDGSEIFERYLEGDIFEGTVDVPIGKYKVIVMNESVEDADTYWYKAITFADEDDFDKFSATVNPITDAAREENFPFYQPVADERVIVEPLHLASWSLGELDVAPSTVLASHGGTRADDDALDALSNIVMRRLTYNVTVAAHVTNLVSVHKLFAAAKGFSDKVYMASGNTVQEPSTYLFEFKEVEWDGEKIDGTATDTFLSFGRLPDETAAETYLIALDILLVTGELYTADAPLVFDVTDQVTKSIDLDIDLNIPDEEGGNIDLPFVEGGVSIGDWDDEVIPLQ